MASITGVQIEASVVERLMAGDRAAQEEVFRKLSPRVHSMAVRVLGDPHLAEDVTQDTFIDILTKSHTLRDPAQFIGWVRTVAINRCFMKMRSPWHRRKVNYEPPEQFEETQLGDEIDIERALAQMDSKTRLVVWLYCVEGYTHEEIGKTLKKSTSYSKVILSRLSKKVAAANSSQSTKQNFTPKHSVSPTWNAI